MPGKRLVQLTLFGRFTRSKTRDFVLQDQFLPLDRGNASLIPSGVRELQPELVVEGTMLPLQLSEMRALRHQSTPPCVMPTKGSVAHQGIAASGIRGASQTRLTHVDNRPAGY